MKRLVAIVLVSLTSCAHMGLLRESSDGARGWEALLDGRRAAARVALTRAGASELRAVYGLALADEAVGDVEHAWARFADLLASGAAIGRSETRFPDPVWPRLMLAAARHLESLVADVPQIVDGKRA